MSYTAIPHLNLTDGRAREALEFYRDVFDAELLIHTYAEFGMPADQPDAQKVVFGQVTSADGFVLMAYDIPGQTPPGMQNPHSTRREHGVTLTDQAMFISLRTASLDEATAVWNRLDVDATPVEPLAQSNWSAGFGILTDRYGVTWLINVHNPS